MRKIEGLRNGSFVTLSAAECREIQGRITHLQDELTVEKNRRSLLHKPNAMIVMEGENAQLKRLNAHLQLQVDQVTKATNETLERLSSAYRASQAENEGLKQIIALQDEKQALTVSRYEGRMKVFQDHLAQLEAELDRVIEHLKKEAVPPVAVREVSNSSLLNWMNSNADSTKTVESDLGASILTINSSFRT